MATSKGVPDIVKSALPSVDDSPLGTNDHFAVQSEIDDIKPRWKQFGAALGIKQATLSTIQTTHPQNPEECLAVVLTEFLSMNYDGVAELGPPTWRMIVSALGHKNGGNNPGLALEVAKDHPATKTGASTDSAAGSSGGGGGGGDDGGAKAKSGDSGKASKDKSILKERPDMSRLVAIAYRIEGSPKEYYRPLQEMGPYWEDIANYLKLSRGVISNARQQHSQDGSAREIMDKWLGTEVDASWSKLLKAMKTIPDLTVSAQTFKTALLNMVDDDSDDSD